MSKHTPEPWYCQDNGTYFDIYGDNDQQRIGDTCASSCDGNRGLGDINARRIVACVNACEGMETEHIENQSMLGETLIDRFNLLKREVGELTKQRDELLAALQGMIDIASDSQGVAGYHLNGTVAYWGEFEEWQSACDAIAKAKGGAV